MADTAAPHPLDDMRAGTKKSLNVALFESLRTELLDGSIPPGTKLKIPDICKRFNVSPGVAREALSRLVPEGLIDFTDQRGYRSPPVTVSDIRDITNVRLLIEREALKDSIRNGDEAWEGGILAAQHRLVRAGEAEGGSHSSAEWADRHRDFHRSLLAACTSPWLLRLHETLYSQTERYRFISAQAPQQAKISKRDVNGEHAEIAEAVIARDELRAQALMEAHLRRTTERVIAAALQSDAIRTR